MSGLQMYMLLGALIFLLGLHGLLILADPIRRLIAVNLMGGGTFMIMVTLARRSEPADPLLHALVVTGLVVAISATAFALRLITASLATESPGEPEHKAVQLPTDSDDRGQPPA
jgi:multicomponent Na+:H+ antiporter subunit C